MLWLKMIVVNEEKPYLLFQKKVDQNFEWNFVVANCKINHKSIKGGFDMHSCREQFWSKKTLDFEVCKKIAKFDLN